MFRTLTQPKYSVLIRLFQDTSDAAGLTLIIQMERMRVAEVIAARDTVVERLEDAYVSVRQKSATIDRLQRELDDLRRPSTPATSVARDDDSSTQPGPVQDIATSFDIPQPAPREGNGNCQNTSAQVLPWQVPLNTPNRPGSTGLPPTPPLDSRPESRCDSNFFSPSFQSNHCARLKNSFDSHRFETVDFDHPVSQYMRFLLPSRGNLMFRILPNHFRLAMDPRH